MSNQEEEKNVIIELLLSIVNLIYSLVGLILVFIYLFTPLLLVIGFGLFAIFGFKDDYILDKNVDSIYSS